MRTPEEKEFHRAHAARATERAKAVLKRGDVIQYTLCGGARGRATFVEWDGSWACSISRSDIHALSIFRLNGELVSFRDNGEDPRRHHQ